VITVWFGNPKVLYVKRTTGTFATVLKTAPAPFAVTGEEYKALIGRSLRIKRIFIVWVPVCRYYLADPEPMKLHLFVASYHLNHYVHGGSAPGQIQ
jgi:hypothetical protein